MGILLIQGGDEFHEACREMDRAFLDAAGRGPVVILPAASEDPTAEQATAAHALDYYRSLGVEEVSAVSGDPSPTDLAQAQVVILPGGSPGRLLERLTADQGHLADALRAVLLAGGGISGSSAGAMVLASSTWLPDREQVVPGLGMLPEEALVVLPHADGTPTRWLGIADRVPPGTHCLALAEHAGRLYDGGSGAITDFGQVFLWE
jgi:peptidase E